MMAASPGLFDHSLPHGFHYRENFITEAEERVLLDAIGHVAFSDFEMRGVVARRRVAFFGQSYDREAAGPLPAFLLPLRATIAQWAGVDADAFAMALINEYRPGSPIGWHRDAPQYDIVAGHFAAVGMSNEDSVRTVLHRHQRCGPLVDRRHTKSSSRGVPRIS